MPGKRRIRVTEWERDEFGQLHEKHRTRKGQCYWCGWPAYRVIAVKVGGKLRDVPVCNRERRRVELNGDLRNLLRHLREKDVDFGRARIREAKERITAKEVTAKINALRDADGLKPVSYEVVRRHVCYHLEGFQGFYIQGE